MNRDGSVILPLWGLDNGQVSLPRPHEWHHGTLLFRVWWDDPAAVPLDPIHGFVAPYRLPYGRHNGSELDQYVYNHVNGQSQQSPFISTSLSLFWTLATAFKMSRSPQREGRTVKISIIRAISVKPDDMIIALHHLPEANGCSRIQQLRNFADQSQEVLIKHQIPMKAVIGTFSFTTFQSRDHDPFWVPEFPWLTFPFNDIPAKLYAEIWLGTFIKGEWGAQHAMMSLRLAARLLSARQESFVGVQEDVMTLAIYLYRWPSSRCAEVFRPKWNDSFRIMNECWTVLQEEAATQRKPAREPMTFCAF
jgi:hypothetical protein